PYELQKRTPDDEIIRRYISLVRELGKFPVVGEIRRRARADKSFPNHQAFDRFGGKGALIEASVTYARENPGFDDILALHSHLPAPLRGLEKRRKMGSPLSVGFVYLIKSGRHYKIGHTNSLGRRESELKTAMALPPTTIHSIKTDDPAGVE